MGFGDEKCDLFRGRTDGDGGQVPALVPHLLTAPLSSPPKFLLWPPLVDSCEQAVAPDHSYPHLGNTPHFHHLIHPQRIFSP